VKYAFATVKKAPDDAPRENHNKPDDALSEGGFRFNDKEPTGYSAVREHEEDSVFCSGLHVCEIREPFLALYVTSQPFAQCANKLDQ